MPIEAGAGLGGITIRDIAARFPMPTAAWRTVTTADVPAACARHNGPLTSRTSDHPVRRAVPAGCQGMPEQTGQEDAAALASFRQGLGRTGRVDPAQPNVQQMQPSVPQTPVPTGLPVGGADGTGREVKVTEVAPSREVAPRGLAVQGTADPAVWAEVVHAGAEEGAVEAADAGGDRTDG